MAVRPRRTLLLILLALPLLVGLIRPAAAGGDDAIRGVIESQLQAFRADDAARAYSYAAPAIRRMFPSAEIFMTMVRNGYPEVYRPRDYRFDELVANGATPMQKVWITGDNGERVLALYTMTRLADGSWRIAGCVLLRPEETSA